MKKTDEHLSFNLASERKEVNERLELVDQLKSLGPVHIQCERRATMCIFSTRRETKQVWMCPLLPSIPRSGQN